MKKYNLIILIFCTSFFATCISFKPITHFDCTVKINDSIHIDQTEVNVHAWLTYYTWKLKNEGQIAASKLLPDSSAIDPLVWQYINHKSSEFSDQISILTNQPLGYFCTQCDESARSNKNLSSVGSSICPILYYPITGLTHQQVVDFCKWRTSVFGEGKVEFKLPSEKEWFEIAKNGFNENEMKIGYMDSALYKGKVCRRYNYRVTIPCSHMIKEGQTSALLDVNARFSPDNKGVWDLFGNVSEMVEENGIAKGGSYLQFASQCHPDSVQHYSKPEKWLGFRCILIQQK